jgi:hypothetical protein
MTDKQNPYASDSGLGVLFRRRTGLLSQLNALVFDLPAYPKTYRVVSCIAALATFIVLLSFSSYTVQLALNGFNSGQSGCLGSEFGWFILFLLTALPASLIGLVCTLWLQRWMWLCVLTFVPPAWFLLLCRIEG